jgi:hypothetical protein
MVCRGLHSHFAFDGHVVVLIRVIQGRSPLRGSSSERPSSERPNAAANRTSDEVIPVLRHLSCGLCFALGSAALGAANREQDRLANCGVVMPEIIDVPDNIP